MRELKMYLPAFISLGLILGLAIIFLNEKKKMITTPKEETHYVIITDSTDDADKKTYNDYIYLKGISNIKYNDQDLKDYLKEDSNGFNNILKLLKQIKENDENTLYIDNNGISNDGLKIVKCNTGSYIIGNKNLEYNENLCQD
jgi:hypothetical protein